MPQQKIPEPGTPVCIVSLYKSARNKSNCVGGATAHPANLAPDKVDTELQVSDELQGFEGLRKKSEDLGSPLISALLLLAHRMSNSVEQDRHQNDSEPALKGFANVQALHPPQHDITQARSSDKRGQHHQCQCHHHCLIDA